eukprot:CAMPEP_0194208084 /NCGR_PEP_ID=MMETSP0156-20130528/6636_1 /TAXON_ID=33649 /ORGANISM="Thalassionema nitzschioides, Strain L26-B" /LENGTH=390 /DNA_ID=CAMNT_0038934975 /DNA_START=207 /DNA_END=1377 /DNA_ORIENTATION=-
MESTAQPRPPKHVVIVGGGVIGTTTAYYLAEHHEISSTIIDPSGTIAPAASGKAGGFLALDWNDYSPVGPLARRSFQLHQEIADKLGGDKIQYRRLTCASIRVGPRAAAKPKGKKLEYVEWAQTEEDFSTVLAARPLGDESTIAQVHPKLLCQSLWEVASKSKEEGGVGSNLVQGKAVGVEYDEKTEKLVGVRMEGTDTIIEGDAVLFACGPWTANIMTGVKYHSVVIPTDQTLSQCVFFSGCGDPEVYVRPDNTAYCCGFPDAEVRVQEEPGQEEVRPEAVQRIVDAVKEASGGSLDGDNASLPAKSSSCYLPTTPDNLPIMGPLLSKDCGGGPGCYIATGHSCWGILMGPASGESMAALIATGKSNHVNIDPFDPARFQDDMLVLKKS